MLISTLRWKIHLGSSRFTRKLSSSTGSASVWRHRLDTNSLTPRVSVIVMLRDSATIHVGHTFTLRTSMNFTGDRDLHIAHVRDFSGVRDAMSDISHKGVSMHVLTDGCLLLTFLHRFSKAMQFAASQLLCSGPSTCPSPLEVAWTLRTPDTSGETHENRPQDQRPSRRKARNSSIDLHRLTRARVHCQGKHCRERKMFREVISRAIQVSRTHPVAPKHKKQHTQYV